MFTKKEIANFRRRIQKANNSFSVMGDMLLMIELESMEGEKAKELQAKLLEGKSPLSYAALDKKVSQWVVK